MDTLNCLGLRHSRIGSGYCTTSHVLSATTRAPLDSRTQTDTRRYEYKRHFLGRREIDCRLRTTIGATTGSAVGFVSSLEEAASRFKELVSELGVVGDDEVLALKEGDFGANMFIYWFLDSSF